MPGQEPFLIKIQVCQRRIRTLLHLGAGNPHLAKRPLTRAPVPMVTRAMLKSAHTLCNFIRRKADESRGLIEGSFILITPTRGGRPCRTLWRCR